MAGPCSGTVGPALPRAAARAWLSVPGIPAVPGLWRPAMGAQSATRAGRAGNLWEAATYPAQPSTSADGAAAANHLRRTPRLLAALSGAIRGNTQKLSLSSDNWGPPGRTAARAP